MAMKAAHDLDRADSDAIVVRGSNWIISSRVSRGSIERIIIRVPVNQGQRWGQSVASVTPWS